MLSGFRAFSLFFCVMLVSNSANADSVTVSISGTSQTLSPSADSLTLNANTLSASDGETFTLQSGTFNVGNSGYLMGDYPLNAIETVTVKGAASPIAFAGVVSVTNPTSLNQDQLTLTALPVFFPSSGAYLTPTVVTTASGGVGAAIPVTIQANLTIPALTPAEKHISALTSFALAGLTAAYGVCIVLEPCGAIVTSAGATAADVAVVGAGGTLTSAGYGLLAADPIDLNYKTVALPATPVVPTLSATAPSSFRNIVTAEASADSLMTAMITSFNRFEGATASNAPFYEQLQLNAFDTYQSELNQDFLQIGTGFDQIGELVDGQYPNLFGNYGNDLISSVSTDNAAPEPTTVWLGGIGISLLLCFKYKNIFMTYLRRAVQ